MNHAQQVQARDKVAVVLYSLPGCVQCTAMVRKLDKHDIPYSKIDASKDPEAAEFIKGLGYTKAPVTYVSAIDGDHHWGGYDVDEIETHLTARADAA